MHYQRKAKFNFNLAVVFASGSILMLASCVASVFSGFAVGAIMFAAIAVMLTLPTTVAIEDYRRYRDRAAQDEETRCRISRQ